MRRSLLVFLVVGVSILLTSGLSWGQCPEDPNDVGSCDTLHVEPYSYALPGSYPADVEVALRVTHDVPTPLTDSLGGLVIPLCFTSSNAAANATIDPTKNNLYLAPFPPNLLENSIFQHLPDMATQTETNWMMDLSEQYMTAPGLAWSTILLDLTTQSNIFWLTAIGADPTNQMLGDESRALLATITFTIDDTTTLCIDSCFQPPTGRLLFSDKGGTGTFIPRHNLPFCYISTDVREMPELADSRPPEFSLSQNYPNPFNPVTNVEFSVSRTAHVKLDIFNIVGQKVRTLVDEEMKAGKYVVDWDGKDENAHWVSSGIYFYRMKAEDFSDMKKMLLVK